jgi:hypothetical protein
MAYAQKLRHHDADYTEGGTYATGSAPFTQPSGFQRVGGLMPEFPGAPAWNSSGDGLRRVGRLGLAIKSASGEPPIGQLSQLSYCPRGRSAPEEHVGAMSCETGPGEAPWCFSIPFRLTRERLQHTGHASA